MKLRFWGVRGSLPAPLSARQIQSKMVAMLERVRPEDLESAEARERFLAHLPPWLFGTVGGNTSCVELSTDAGETIVFDAGSGLRELGIDSYKRRPPISSFHFFFSHFHWDHIQGFPFFGPAYDPNINMTFYSPENYLEKTLSDQMLPPCFPVPIESMGAKKHFVHLNDKVEIGSATVSWRKMNHPGGSYAYAVTDGLKHIVYATDSELVADDFIRDDERAAIFGGADVIVVDAQYTLGEAIEKYNWGHSAFSMAIDFASNWGIGTVVLFHHDPTYDDRKLYKILQSARWYTDHMSIKGVKVLLAREGMELEI